MGHFQTNKQSSIWDTIQTDPDLHGEVKLWLYVIYSAYEEILNARPGRDTAEYRQARAFLFEKNDVFGIAAAVF